ncbi:MAG: hypothetical protein GTO63_15180, partial [Anaerolineae bacterium]|nr:hypothetical protein [Anaerolineae bacterium]NIN96173.1 hypothetical protein [Anaerolineae bacterium]NIQ79176.1 hypothetical protein [Anaerolineae bacterium]
WKTSEHALSLDDPGHDDNAYCARCKSPFEWFDGATRDDIVPEDEWQGITCGVCHPPKALRDELGLSHFALYDAENGEYIEMYDEEADEISEA